jgi:hypothetical protein
MSHIEVAHTKPEAPWRFPLFWWVMGSLLPAILALTMIKDLYLAGDEPNPVFYLTVPLVSIAGSTVAGSLTLRLFEQFAGWVDVLAIALITAFLGQVFENTSKLLWHLVWGYPGWLYLLAILGLGLLVPAWCLVRWLRLRWLLAVGVAMGMFTGEMIFVLAFTSLTGIGTPGS